MSLFVVIGRAVALLRVSVFVTVREFIEFDPVEVILPVTLPVKSPVTSPVTFPVKSPVTSPVTSPIMVPDAVMSEQLMSPDTVSKGPLLLPSYESALKWMISFVAVL